MRKLYATHRRHILYALFAECIAGLTIEASFHWADTANAQLVGELLVAAVMLSLTSTAHNHNDLMYTSSTGQVHKDSLLDINTCSFIATTNLIMNIWLNNLNSMLTTKFSENYSVCFNQLLSLFSLSSNKLRHVRDMLGFLHVHFFARIVAGSSGMMLSSSSYRQCDPSTNLITANIETTLLYLFLGNFLALC